MSLLCLSERNCSNVGHQTFPPKSFDQFGQKMKVACVNNSHCRSLQPHEIRNSNLNMKQTSEMISSCIITTVGTGDPCPTRSFSPWTPERMMLRVVTSYLLSFRHRTRPLGVIRGVGLVFFDES